MSPSECGSDWEVPCSPAACRITRPAVRELCIIVCYGENTGPLDRSCFEIVSRDGHFPVPNDVDLDHVRIYKFERPRFETRAAEIGVGEV